MHDSGKQVENAIDCKNMKPHTAFQFKSKKINISFVFLEIFGNFFCAMAIPLCCSIVKQTILLKYFFPGDMGEYCWQNKECFRL